MICTTGLEGHIRENFDITADGHVTNPRAVVAYPPLVFEASTQKIAQSFRYVPPKIGDKLVGCVGQTEPFNYKISR